MTKHIAWVDRKYELVDLMKWDIERRYECKIDYMPTPDMAQKDLSDTLYDLIVINLSRDKNWGSAVNPDSDHAKQLKQRNRIEQARFINRIRTKEGPNKNTPIIAFYPTEPMELTDKLKQADMLKRAGADELFDLNRSGGSFVSYILVAIQKYLK